MWKWGSAMGLRLSPRTDLTYLSRIPCGNRWEIEEARHTRRISGNCGFFECSGSFRVGAPMGKREANKGITVSKLGVDRGKKTGSGPDSRRKRLENVIEEIDNVGSSENENKSHVAGRKKLGVKEPGTLPRHQPQYRDERGERSEHERLDSWDGNRSSRNQLQRKSGMLLDQEFRQADRPYEKPAIREERLDNVDPDGDTGRGARFLRKMRKSSTENEDMVVKPIEKGVAAQKTPLRSQRAGGRLVRESDKLAIVAPWKPTCYGCGVVLQTISEQAPGYVGPLRFELKKKHHQLRNLLCGRCVELSQGHMVAAVSGHGGYGDGPGFLSASDLRSQLAHLKSQKALIVKLVDIVDFNGSFLSKVRDLVGPNPIVLVITKVDLLPKGTDMEAVGDWVLTAVARKKLNVVSIHLTSAKAELGIGSVAAKLRERQGRDVYVVGAANVGKSAFISALLEEMAGRDPAAAAARRRKPMQSAMPGTTLGHISIKAFSGGGDLFDTPGVHLHHRVAAVISPVDLPALAPRRRLKGFTPGLPSSTLEDESNDWEEVFDNLLPATSAAVELETAPSVDELSRVLDDDSVEDEEELSSREGLRGCSLFWGGLVRIDVLEAPASARFTFMGPGQIRVHCISTDRADDFYKENVGSLLVPPTAKGGDKASAWEDLPARQSLTIPAPQGARPSADIAFSGLGWVSVRNDEAVLRRLLSADQEGGGESPGVVRLEVRTPKGVEVYVRPPMPVGPEAKSWYEWRELPEEGEVEPVVFYEKVEGAGVVVGHL